MQQRTQIFEVSTLYGAATLAAALDAGQFGSAAGARRILLVSNNAAIPETAVQLSEMNGWQPIAARFGEILDWNEEIRPQHPGDWCPDPADAPMLERLLKQSWQLGEGPLEIAVESVTAAPAKALTRIFADAALHVYADGLMSYGPTRDKLPQHVACRIQRLLHLDLVPGLEPLLLSEFGVPAELVPNEAFRKILDEIATAEAPVQDSADAIILGQYLAALNILSPAEEEAMLVDMVRGAAGAGHRSLVFKPHPTAPAGQHRALEEAAAEAGASLTVIDRPMLAETLFEQLRPRLVIGCFSTAMLTAAGFYGLPVARTGTELLLERLKPYENSNRIPVTIVDSLVPEMGAKQPHRSAKELEPLLRTVGYCMQADRHRRLRPEAESWLKAHLGEGNWRYFKRRRLTILELPGGISQTTARPILRAARKARKLAKSFSRATS